MATGFRFADFSDFIAQISRTTQLLCGFGHLIQDQHRLVLLNSTSTHADSGESSLPDGVRCGEDMLDQIQENKRLSQAEKAEPCAVFSRRRVLGSRAGPVSERADDEPRNTLPSQLYQLPSGLGSCFSEFSLQLRTYVSRSFCRY